MPIAFRTTRASHLVWACVVLVFTAPVLAACSLLPDQDHSAAHRETTSGRLVSSGDADVFALAVGDCFDDPSASEPTRTRAMPCEELHDLEGYFSFTLGEGPFPGEDAVLAQASVGCEAAFAEFAGIGYTDSALEYAYLYPSSRSWAHDDRTVLCAAYDPGTQISGSLRGSAR